MEAKKVDQTKQKNKKASSPKQRPRKKINSTDS